MNNDALPCISECKRNITFKRLIKGEKSQQQFYMYIINPYLYMYIYDVSIIKNDIKFDLSGIESVFMQADN